MPFPSCAADAQWAVRCARSALIDFSCLVRCSAALWAAFDRGVGWLFSMDIVSISALCGLWPHLTEAWLTFFDCFLRKLFLTISPGKIKEGARRPRLWRFKEMRFLREGGNRNPPSLKCVFGYFLHKQKVTEVPGRVALGDEGTAHATIKTKTQPQHPTKNKKGGRGAAPPPKKKSGGYGPRKNKNTPAPGGRGGKKQHRIRTGAPSARWAGNTGSHGPRCRRRGCGPRFP